MSGWYGHETTGRQELRTPMCRVVLDLFDTHPGGSQVSIRMGEEGDLPESQEERKALAGVLQREFRIALNELLLN